MYPDPNITKRLIALRSAAVLVWVLCLFATAGNALGATSQRPAAEDFVISGTSASGGAKEIYRAAAASSRPGATFTLRPGRMFSMVGLKLKTQPRAVWVSAHGAGGWSQWTQAPIDPDHGPDQATNQVATDPVWTGKSDRLRFRITGVSTRRELRSVKLHFINVRPAGESGAQRFAAAAAAGGIGTNAGATDPVTPITPSGSQPVVVPRADWGGDSCRPRRAPAYGEVLGAFIHHTVSTNRYSAAEAKSVVLGICRYHRNSLGWYDIGYNMLVDRFGTIYEGRAGGIDRAVAGAHTQGYNGQSTGIAVIGTHISTPASAATMSALQSLLAWKLPLHGITRNEPVAMNSQGGAVNRFPYGRIVDFQPISGHRDADSTACPGGTLYQRLPELRAGLMPSSRAGTRIFAMSATPTTAAWGATATISARLMSGPRGVGGQSIEIQTYGTTGWVKSGTASTASDGRFRATIPAQRTGSVRAVFTGSDGLRPVRSNEGWLRVAPTLKLSASTPQGATVPVGTDLRLSGSITPGLKPLRVEVWRGKRRVKVLRTKPPGRDFSLSYRLLVAARYRFIAYFAGDSRLGAAKSLPVVIVAR